MATKDPRCKKIVILLDRIVYIYPDDVYNVEEAEFKPVKYKSFIEYYSVYYKGAQIARFWISDEYNPSMETLIPMDASLVEYILEEMNNRRCKEDVTVPKSD